MARRSYHSNCQVENRRERVADARDAGHDLGRLEDERRRSI